jgi:hypothetical protein
MDHQAEHERETADGSRSGSDLGRKYWVALLLYGVLAALCWFTLEGKVLVMGKPVELRLVPLVILGGLVLRTMVAMQAEKIRRSDE